MGDESEQQSLLHSRLKSRRYDDSTLRLLQLMLSSKHPHPHPHPHLRPSLVLLFRSESASAIRALTPDIPIQLKLSTLHFFIHAFAILLDSQSFLSLSYEALTMRHTHPNPHFQVSSHEWINFAQLAFHYAFYPVTIQACKNALLCLSRQADAASACLNIPETTTTIDQIQRLMDAAIVSSSNHSVQAHTTEYVKKKTMIESSVSNETESPASISFRNGIKLHNARKLLRLKNQDLHQSIGTSISN